VSVDSINQRRLLLALIVLSFIARFAISACSIGTSDIPSFNRFAWSIDRDGLLATYRTDVEFNHPPIPPYWAWLAMRITRPLLAHNPNLVMLAFAFVFRMPVILADAGSAWLLWKIWKTRASEINALKTVAFYAWCPAAILVSAYHGNTDPIYAFFCLLCVYLIEDRDAPFLGGLALAAAINIKLVPVLLILPLALSLRRWSDLLKFIGGLAPGVLPFVPPLLFATSSFAHNALAYRSRMELWGIGFFLLASAPDGTTPQAVIAFRDAGRYLLLALVCGWSIAARIWRRWNRYDIAAVTFALFLVFAPGFGVQYLVILLPLMFAARPRIATIYGLFAGMFLLATYFVFWDGEFPLSSLVNLKTFPTPLGAAGLPAWVMLVCYVVIAAWRGTLQEPQSRRGFPIIPSAGGG
jgi:hypothetical protein